MQLQEHKKIYVPDEEIFLFQDTLLDNISFKVFVQCSKEKFLQYQKDILEEFVADFTNIIKTSEELDVIDIRDIFEQNLQVLNTKLKQFAEKVRDIDHFSLKGFIQLVVDEKLMSSMIGNVSMLVMREQKTAYSVPNSVDMKTKIDLFSDFIEGEIERDDQILYVGLKFADVMDAHDLREMEGLLAQEESSEGILSFLEELLTTRIEKYSIGFIVSYFVKGPTIKSPTSRRKSGLKLPGMGGLKDTSQKYMSAIGDKINSSQRMQNLKQQLLENKMYFVGIVLVVLILVFMYALISQILDNNNNQFQTSPGVYIDINLSDIQDDITEFKSLDSSSTLKTTKYKEIEDKLNFLEEQGKWLEDVEDLRAQLKDNYYEGFHIIQFQSANDLDNIGLRNTRILTFTNTDLSKLGEPFSISVPKNMMIAGTKGAFIDISSDANKGYFQSYDFTKSLNGCIASLNSNGMYCYNGSGEIYLISKAKVLPVQTEDGDFRRGIGGLGTFGNRNLYVFRSDVSSLDNMLLTRYQTNSDGTFANFKRGTSYSIAASGVNFGNFSSFAIDGNFFGWADGKLYLFWRDDLAGSTLNYRQIEIRGGNPLTDSYSSNVKIITSGSTRYVFIYDKDQKLLTVYNTEKSKSNEANKRAYQLVYLFSLKFEMDDVEVYDVDVPSSSADRPELYVLSSLGVNKVPLYEYIETLN